MKDRKTAHLYAFMLALAMTGFVIGFGLPVVQAVSDIHNYDVPIRDSIFPWIIGGWMKLQTTSYSDGDNLGTVDASATATSNWPLTIEVTGDSVTFVDDNTKLAKGYYTAIVWLIWPIIPIQTAYFILHTEVQYWGDGFDYSTWWS